MKQGRELFIKLKPVLMLIVHIVTILPFQLRYGIMALFRYTPGLFGLGIRYILLKSLAKKCGDNVAVFPGVFLSYLEELELGNNISIREYCNIGCLGGLTIGNDVSIAHNSTILTTEHDYKQLSVPMRNAPLIKKKTYIHDGVWIGTHVVILAGVEVGSNSVVGAGSVVSKNIPENVVAVGVPATVKTSRLMNND